MADEHTGLGELITTDKGRDAVHIAIAPVTVAEKLFPGQRVVFADDCCERVKGAPANAWIGIVDPFLTAPVFPGQRFWLWMRPGSITSLRHEWTHPAFAAQSNSDTKESSERWIRNLAEEHNVTYRQIMEHAAMQASGDEFPYLIGGSEMEGSSTPQEFWDHYETVTGQKVPDARRENFFSCSC